MAVGPVHHGRNAYLRYARSAGFFSKFRAFYGIFRIAIHVAFFSYLLSDPAVYIRRKRKGVVVHEESRTFPTRPQPVLWAKRREVELAEPDALAVAEMGELSIAALIKRYIAEFEQIEGEDGSKKWGRTKSADLRKLLGCRGLRLTAKSNERDRTPTYEELQKLDAHFERQDKHRSAKIPPCVTVVVASIPR